MQNKIKIFFKKKSHKDKWGLIGLSFITILIVFSFVILNSCTNKEDKNVIKIGAILPLTGNAGKYGEDAKLGIKLALDRINSKGGIKGKLVKIIFEDDQSSPQQAVAAFKKLITTHKVPIIIGPMTSSATLALAPIAEQNKVVLFSPSASAPSISKAGDFIFRNELSDTYGGLVQAKLTWKKLGIKKVAILYINNDYGIGIKEAFEKTFKKLGGKVVASESFEPDAKDFRTQLIRIKQKSPEAIFLIAYKESILILKQLKELGIKTTILSTPVFEDREIIEKAGNLAEGVIYAYYGSFDPNRGNEYLNRFVEAFRRKYGRNPSYYSALAYDAMNIVAYAITKGGIKSNCIKNALYHLKDFPGVTGKTSFDTNGDVIKPVVLKTIKNGKFVKLTI